MTELNDEHLGTALLLICDAGATTAIGVLEVFSPHLVKLASRQALVASLGFLVSLMTYVPFVEILPKSLVSFEASGYEENMLYIFVTLSFFSGILMMKMSGSCPIVSV